MGKTWTLMLGRTTGKRRRGQQGMRWLDSITDSTDTKLSNLWETVEGRVAWRAAVHGVTKSQTRLNDRTTARRIYRGGDMGTLQTTFAALL